MDISNVDGVSHNNSRVPATCILSYEIYYRKKNVLGPVVQSIVSLTSSLVVKMLTVLVSTISNSQVFSLKKM